MPEKEHIDTLKNPKFFPKKQLQISSSSTTAATACCSKFRMMAVCSTSK